MGSKQDQSKVPALCYRVEFGPRLVQLWIELQRSWQWSDLGGIGHYRLRLAKQWPEEPRRYQFSGKYPGVS